MLCILHQFFSEVTSRQACAQRKLLRLVEDLRNRHLALLTGSIRRFLQILIVPCVARQDLPNASLTRDGNKHMYIGHPLPDFYLQNTCKFPAKPVIAWRPVARPAPVLHQDMPRGLKNDTLIQ